ncbi:MAG: polysaccharide deacetylase family protein [Acidobacteriia bacterium]|nr:polysaccharide deacetylase family protein [Terriglobia bacterium]
MEAPQLHIVVYHYVRDLPRTRFPRIKGMLTSDFRAQVSALKSRFEMASLESALAFLQGRYSPASDLCLLTFDDGLKEHYTEATTLLSELGVQGLFFVITGCLEERFVAPVHMNHFLMASLGFEKYHTAFREQLNGHTPRLDPERAAVTYPWDTPDVAAFKYLFNFQLATGERDDIVRRLFSQCLGNEKEFAESLYVSWEEAVRMQSAGMIIGGHSHAHHPLSRLSGKALENDLDRCRALLASRLKTQQCWPFCYPYGKKDSFSEETVRVLERNGFACSFTTETGPNRPGVDLFSINRVDCKCAPLA